MNKQLHLTLLTGELIKITASIDDIAQSGELKYYLGLHDLIKKSRILLNDIEELKGIILEEAQEN